ncbi:hypothetical protein Q9233_001324 [Columba guinea]|nr:hypothetical protein Q9233_001324 [Columba guinea]
MASGYAHAMERQALLPARLDGPAGLDNLQAKKNFSVSHLLDLEEAGDMVAAQADEGSGEPGRSLLESPGLTSGSDTPQQDTDGQRAADVRWLPWDERGKPVSLIPWAVLSYSEGPTVLQGSPTLLTPKFAGPAHIRHPLVDLYMCKYITLPVLFLRDSAGLYNVALEDGVRLLCWVQLGYLWEQEGPSQPRESMWMGKGHAHWSDPLLGNQATDFLDMPFGLGIVGWKLSRIARDQVTVFPFPKHTRSLQRGTDPEQTPGRFPDSEVYFSGALSKPEWKEHLAVGLTDLGYFAPNGARYSSVAWRFFAAWLDPAQVQLCELSVSFARPSLAISRALWLNLAGM